jgi:hypothetical protein
MRFFNWWVAKLNSRVEGKYQGKGRKVQTSAIESGHRNCIAIGKIGNVLESWIRCITLKHASLKDHTIEY